jgi:hypothetical protein
MELKVRKKPTKKTNRNNGYHPVEYKVYFVPAGGRDPALVEAATYYNNLKRKGHIKDSWVKNLGGPSLTTVRRYTTDGKRSTKRPNATTFFAFLATLPGVKGYDIRKKTLILGE